MSEQVQIRETLYCRRTYWLGITTIVLLVVVIVGLYLCCRQGEPPSFIRLRALNPYMPPATVTEAKAVHSSGQTTNFLELRPALGVTMAPPVAARVPDPITEEPPPIESVRFTVNIDGVPNPVQVEVKDLPGIQDAEIYLVVGNDSRVRLYVLYQIVGGGAMLKWEESAP